MKIIHNFADELRPVKSENEHLHICKETEKFANKLKEDSIRLTKKNTHVLVISSLLLIFSGLLGILQFWGTQVGHEMNKTMWTGREILVLVMYGIAFLLFLRILVMQCMYRHELKHTADPVQLQNYINDGNFAVADVSYETLSHRKGTENALYAAIYGEKTKTLYYRASPPSSNRQYKAKPVRQVDLEETTDFERRKALLIIAPRPATGSETEYEYIVRPYFEEEK